VVAQHVAHATGHRALDAHMSSVLRVAHLKQLGVKPAAVHPQLLYRTGPERVAGSDEHGVLAFFDVAAHLEGRGGG